MLYVRTYYIKYVPISLSISKYYWMLDDNVGLLTSLLASLHSVYILYPQLISLGWVLQSCRFSNRAYDIIHQTFNSLISAKKTWKYWFDFVTEKWKFIKSESRLNGIIRVWCLVCCRFSGVETSWNDVGWWWWGWREWSGIGGLHHPAPLRPPCAARATPLREPQVPSSGSPTLAYS